MKTMTTCMCETCQAPFEVTAAYIRFLAKKGQRGGRFCSSACYGIGQRGVLSEERIRASSVIDDASGCWQWVGAMMPNGYGVYGKVDAANSSLSAHRASYMIFHGAIPDDLMVRHKCDNRACVNPDHLESGTCADNIHDAVERGRNARGSRNAHAILTESEIPAIRARVDGGETQTSVAVSVGMSISTVHLIAHRKQWKHVPEVTRERAA